MRNDYPTGDVARSRGARRLSLSGAYGELSRGHNYFPDAREDGETAVTRYVTYMGRIRRELSQAVRDRGVERTWAVIEEGRAAGLAGKHLNDYLFYAGRVRLGYPQPAFPAFLPMLTTELLLATFLAPPDEKLDNRAIREATVRLAPFWRDVPYERELGKDRPPREVNKSQVQPTFWEVDRDQYLRYGHARPGGPAAAGADRSGRREDDGRATGRPGPDEPDHGVHPMASGGTSRDGGTRGAAGRASLRLRWATRPHFFVRRHDERRHGSYRQREAFRSRRTLPPLRRMKDA